jgi:UDP:flavonoid glycosyltransferase YjiC (YdhE family)
VHSAVHHVLNDKTYRANARRLQDEFGRYTALDSITWYVESFLTENTDRAPDASLQPGIREEAQRA